MCDNATHAVIGRLSPATNVPEEVLPIDRGLSVSREIEHGLQKHPVQSTRQHSKRNVA